MPTLFKGSATYRRFQLAGDMPIDIRGALTQNALKHAFRPLGPEDPTLERSAGWVNIHDHLDADLTGQKLFFDDHMLFALRIDKKAVPNSILRARIQQAEKARLEEIGREVLTRAERRALRDGVRLNLMQAVLPSMITFDVAVDLTGRQVRFWSTTRGVLEEFMELFETTFKLSLLPLGAYGLASRALDSVQMERFSDLDPSVFARPMASKESAA